MNFELTGVRYWKESFKSLNNGKKLTRSQEKLLGLKKIKIDRKDK